MLKRAPSPRPASHAVNNIETFYPIPLTRDTYGSVITQQLQSDTDDESDTDSAEELSDIKSDSEEEEEEHSQERFPQPKRGRSQSDSVLVLVPRQKWPVGCMGHSGGHSRGHVMGDNISFSYSESSSGDNFSDTSSTVSSTVSTTVSSTEEEIELAVFNLADKYTFINRLHHTGNSVAYKALHKRTNTMVAIKIQAWEPNQKRDPMEVRILSHLSGFRHCQQLREFYRFPSTIAIISDLYVEDPVEQCLYGHPGKIQEFMRQLLETLDYLHGNNIIHRDIKFDNVLWDDAARLLVLIDYDVSTFNRDNHTRFAGTHGYEAPEMAFIYRLKNTDITYNQSVDIWSAGVMLGMLINEVPQEDITANRVKLWVRDLENKLENKMELLPQEHLLRSMLTAVEHRPTAKTLLETEPFMEITVPMMLRSLEEFRIDPTKSKYSFPYSLSRKCRSILYEVCRDNCELQYEAVGQPPARYATITKIAVTGVTHAQALERSFLSDFMLPSSTSNALLSKYDIFLGYHRKRKYQQDVLAYFKGDSKKWVSHRSECRQILLNVLRENCGSLSGSHQGFVAEKLHPAVTQPLKGNIYKPTNDQGVFISIDIHAAQFSALHFINPEWVNNQFTWTTFVQSLFGDTPVAKYFQHAKKWRLITLSYLKEGVTVKNLRRVGKYMTRSITNKLATYERLAKMIVHENDDEVVLKSSLDSYEQDTQEIRECISSLQSFRYVGITPFKLQRLDPQDFYLKLFLDGLSPPVWKCIPPTMMDVAFELAKPFI